MDVGIETNKQRRDKAEDQRIVTMLALQNPGAETLEIATKHYDIAGYRLEEEEVRFYISQAKESVVNIVPDSIREFFLYELARMDVLENVLWAAYTKSQQKRAVVDKITATSGKGKKLDPLSFDEHIDKIERTIRHASDGEGNVSILRAIRDVQADRRNFMSSLMKLNELPVTVIEQKEFSDPALLDAWDE